jgi:hypothetical protein
MVPPKTRHAKAVTFIALHIPVSKKQLEQVLRWSARIWEGSQPMTLLPYMLTSNLTDALKIWVLTTGVAPLIFFGVKGHSTGVNRFVSTGQTLLVGGLAAGAAFWLAHLFDG